MPRFDLAPKAVQQVNVVGQRDDSTALQIKQQGMQFVEQGVRDVVGVTRDKFKEMDEADMVSARSAMLRIQSDEDKELLSTSNPADIKKIQEKYNKRYEKIIDGNEPLNDKPYFRNQSGKNAFKKGFVNQFNGSRYLQGEKQEFELQRRDTQVKYTNGIKSIIDQPDWNTPTAHRELEEIANKFFQDGFHTAEENVAYKKEQHQILDTERANKMFADMEALPVETPNSQDELKINKEIYSSENDKYKEYINSLNHLDQDQKNKYNKQSDALYSDRVKTASLQMKEAGNAVKRSSVDYDTDLEQKYYMGKIKASVIMKDPNASVELKRRMKSDASEEIKSLVDNIPEKPSVNEGIQAEVNKYDRYNDPDGSKQRKIMEAIAGSSMATSVKSHLTGIMKNGLPLNDAQKAKSDNAKRELTNVLGLDINYQNLSEMQLKYGKIEVFGIDPQRAEWDKENSVMMFDALTEFQRNEAFNKIFIKYNYLLEKNRDDDADKFLQEAITDFRKKKDDNDAFNKLMSEDLYKVRGK